MKHSVVIMDVFFDNNGDPDRESFLLEARGVRPVIKDVRPPLGASK